MDDETLVSNWIRQALDENRRRHEEAMKTGKCHRCDLSAAARCYSDAGRREYRISGLCEVCFDEMFQEREEREEAHEAGE